MSTPATYENGGSTGAKTVTGGRLMPDEGEIVSDKGLRRVNGGILFHLGFALVVKEEGERGSFRCAPPLAIV